MKPNCLTRRQWLKTSAAIGAAALTGTLTPWRLRAAEPAQRAAIDLGSRRELFVDDFLIARHGRRGAELHKPEPRDVALVCDRAVGGQHVGLLHALLATATASASITAARTSTRRRRSRAHPEFTCYAESRDGLKWEKPRAGLVRVRRLEREQHRLDRARARTTSRRSRTATRPARPTPATRRWRAGARWSTARRRAACNAFKSPDGIHWTLMSRGRHHRRRVRFAEPGLLGRRARRVSGLLADLHRRLHRRAGWKPAFGHPHGDLEGFRPLGEPGRPDATWTRPPSTSTRTP